MAEAKRKNVLVLTYWSYRDALVQSYTLPYVRMIRRNLPPDSKIYLVTLEQERLKMSADESSRVKAELAAEGIELISSDYSRFGLKAAAKWQLLLMKLLALCYMKRITHIHAWCTPAGMIGYILSVLTGRPLVIDSYEPHAESMVELGQWSKDSSAFKILFRFERLQSRRARAVIATTEGLKSYAREKYGVELRNFFVKPAGVDLKLFSFDDVKNPALLEAYGLKGKIVCVYAGKIGGIYLKQEIFDFFRAASTYWGERFRVLLLTNTSRAEIASLAAASNLDPAIIISKFVAHDEVPKHIGVGDFAINPVRPVPTKRYCTSIKDGEYWAMGLPVVIPPSISDDSEIISEYGIGAVLKGFDEQSYAAAVREIDEMLKSHSRQSLFDKIRAVAVKYRKYENAEAIYEKLYGA